MKALVSILVFACLAQAGEAADWPMWRYDAGRGGSSPDALPAHLELQWTRQLPDPSPAWPEEQARLRFDQQAEPVVMGQRIFVPSSRHDTVTAYSTRDGSELWRFHADGPVRFAPVAHAGRVFFTSDDGRLYALDAATGTLIWKVEGSPRRRLNLGNNRLISSWPARGGVVLHRGKLYFAASIWPFMGIFIHAVAPDTGAILWSNSGDGTNWTTQPHGAPSFASVVPQGHLAAAGNDLIIPGGRSNPAILDATTGRQRFFRFDKREGGHHVGGTGSLYFCAGHAYTLKDGSPVGGGAPAIFNAATLYAADPRSILVRSARVDLQTRESIDRKGTAVRETIPEYRTVSQTLLDQPINGRWMIQAGPRLYAGGKGTVAAYEEGRPAPVWEGSIDGQAHTMLAADDRLFVLTRAGLLHCFGAESPENIPRHPLETKPLPRLDDRWTAAAARLLQKTGVKQGHALVLGLESGRLVEELISQSPALHVIAVDPDPARIEVLRQRLTASGLYGTRAAAFVGDPATEPFPPYLCRLITSEKEEPANEALVRQAFHTLRPYGGVAHFTGEPVQIDLPGARWEMANGDTFLEREGALPGTSDWTHQYADAAQTVVSRDSRVKAPFGVLWFGGPSHAGILPRHGHGPSPQVAGGRLFIEGPDLLRAVDVYTGDLLWEANLPGLGQYYNTTKHFSGAGEIGSNYVSLADAIYVVYGDSILELDPGSGTRRRAFQLERGTFLGHVSVSGDHLITTGSPVSTTTASHETEADLSDYEVLIPPRAQWRYHLGATPRHTWTSPGYDDASWKSGTAGFGYGDDDDATVLDMKDRFARLWIRHEFEGRPGADLALKVNYDDGFIAYLNGQEVLRRGVNQTGVTSHEASAFETFDLPDHVQLREGRNVLAIEGHNRSSGSSDFTLDPILLKRAPAAPTPAEQWPATRFASGSRHLAVFDRHTGGLRWRREATYNFRHNNIAASGDSLYCIDAMTRERAHALARRGIPLEGTPTLLALDLHTGEVLWKKEDLVFGTFLNYSADHDILLQASSHGRDRAADEIKSGMMALRGATGEVLWHDPRIRYGGPCLLWHDQILTNGTGGFAIDLKTGRRTGWDYQRQYGCNTAVGSEHLLTFRSGAAGFYDLSTHSGTGNLGGFRSSCTNNLIPANGILNAPDYTRTCTCAYQNQTSLALIHMPEAEFWTFGARADTHRTGINFGAPGNRRASTGTLFHEYPGSGADRETPPLQVRGQDLHYRRVHSSTMADSPFAWIGASSVEGVEALRIPHPRAAATGGTCRVRLYFAESGATRPGQRVFDVTIQGQTLLKDFDLAAEAGGPGQVLTKEFTGIPVEQAIEVGFSAKAGTLQPSLAGIEILYPER